MHYCCSAAAVPALQTVVPCCFGFSYLFDFLVYQPSHIRDTYTYSTISASALGEYARNAAAGRLALHGCVRACGRVPMRASTGMYVQLVRTVAGAGIYSATYISEQYYR